MAHGCLGRLLNRRCCFLRKRVQQFFDRSTKGVREPGYEAGIFEQLLGTAERSQVVRADFLLFTHRSFTSLESVS